jgi:RND family efflux transporter MFP subunit
MCPKQALQMLPVAALALLAACAKEAPVEQPEVVRPVKTMLIDAPVSGGVRSFPARIDAYRKAELAFRVPGKVQELLVKEGDQVEEGQDVAKLDPTDYQIVVNDRQATYSNAKKNFDRAKGLIDKGHISKMDYDRLEAEFRNAQAALETARQDLAYTELQAPFAGIIADRHVERFEEVQAKQPVLSLQDASRLDVKFDVPESIVRSFRTATDPESRKARRAKLKIYATFSDLPGQKFPLTFKEVSTRADSKTQTFETTFTMEQVAGATVLPGMTASVTVDLSGFVGDKTLFSVPVNAVVGDYKLDPQVWVVDQESMTVEPRPVEVGRMWEDKIEVNEGLEPGDRLVTAGVPFLVEGMKVTLLPDLEQAEPRPGE